jgi:hypothetical protein
MNSILNEISNSDILYPQPLQLSPVKSTTSVTQAQNADSQPHIGHTSIAKEQEDEGVSKLVVNQFFVGQSRKPRPQPVFL